MGEEISRWANTLLSSLFAQGLPSVVHAALGEEELSSKVNNIDFKNRKLTFH